MRRGLNVRDFLISCTGRQLKGISCFPESQILRNKLSTLQCNIYIYIIDRVRTATCDRMKFEGFRGFFFLNEKRAVFEGFSEKICMYSRVTFFLICVNKRVDASRQNNYVSP